MSRDGLRGLNNVIRIYVASISWFNFSLCWLHFNADFPNMLLLMASLAPTLHCTFSMQSREKTASSSICSFKEGTHWPGSGHMPIQGLITVAQVV